MKAAHLSLPLLATLLSAFAVMTAAAQASIEAIPLPSGLTVETADLAIRGKVGNGGSLLLDLATIQSLPASSFTCVDPWDGKEHRFTGVLLSELLARAGIEKSATRIVVTARNKYSIPIRRMDYERNGYILAWKLDDRPFGDDKATRNRGMFIIAIDFARHGDLDPQLYKHQLAWQVADILVE